MTQIVTVIKATGIMYVVDTLITEDFFKSNIQSYPTPAILRQPLDRLILNVKKLKPNDEPKKLLSMALTPPELDRIEQTMILLKETGNKRNTKNIN